MKSTNESIVRTIVVRVFFVLMILGAVGLLLFQTPAPVLAQARGLTVKSLLNPDGTLDAVPGVGGAVDLQGWNVKLDPVRGPVVTRANATGTVSGSWAALPNSGLNGTVRTFAVYAGELYAGGDFTATGAGGMTLNYIAKYDGARWIALPNNGLNDSVRTLAVYGNELYVGGSFSETADHTIALRNIAKFNGTGWSALSKGGLSSSVLAMAVYGDNLYVGGAFLKTSDQTLALNRIARFDGSNWYILPNSSLNGNVNALLAVGFDLYVGGDFSATADSVVSLSRIARYSGTWNAVAGGLNNSVSGLALLDGELYAGGSFTSSVNPVTSLNRIARYDSSWHALSGNGLSSNVNALMTFGEYLYVGGAFTATADASETLNRIAVYNEGGWRALPKNGLSDAVSALAVYGGGVFAGGDFLQTQDTSLSLKHIARLNLPTQTGTNLIVNTSADTDDGVCDVFGSGTGNLDCSLREAIQQANAMSGPNTISFDTARTVTLGSTLPTITDEVAISGGGQVVALDGGGAHRILIVDSTASAVNLQNLTFRNGLTDSSLGWGESGGAIYNNGSVLTVSKSTFTNNQANAYGGAIFADGTTLIFNSTFSGNTADGLGGAVLNVQPLTVKNSTFSGGEAPAGAGLYNQNSLTLINTIIGNSSGPDCTNNGTIASEKNNLMERSGGEACDLVNGVGGDITGQDAKLGDLGAHGGVTYTFALLSGSPAIDKGDNSTCADGDIGNKDQRGMTRPLDGDGNQVSVCDMGAYEAPVPNTPTPTRTRTQTSTPTSTRTITPTSTPTGTVCAGKPAAPTLLKPAKGATMSKVKVAFDWSDAACATSYKITVKNTSSAAKVIKTFSLSGGKLKLTHGKQKWSVQACNSFGCTKSKTAKFTN